ncbi:EF1A [Enterospora canceri]|uniref:EF1A n=1 Tax=Enterospora canceri TaxID=1081671 RepID=A0A1Y1S551_9MICR|nr:EF1A [Enterospora canceri]
MVHSLEEAIDYQDAPLRPIDRPLRMPISSIAHVPGHGAVLCGRVDYGFLAKGDNVKILPIGVSAKVKSIEAHKCSLQRADSGENIGFVLDTKDKATVEKIKTGSIAGPSDDGVFVCSPFYLVAGISMKKSKKSGTDQSGIKEGYTPVISCGTANVACKFAKLTKCITKDKVEIENPTIIPTGARFEALIYPTKQVLFEEAASFPGLGKFVCRDSGMLVCAGQIKGKMTEAEAKEKYGLSIAVLSGDKDAIKKAGGKTSKK